MAVPVVSLVLVVCLSLSLGGLIVRILTLLLLLTCFVAQEIINTPLAKDSLQKLVAVIPPC